MAAAEEEELSDNNVGYLRPDTLSYIKHGISHSGTNACQASNIQTVSQRPPLIFPPQVVEKDGNKEAIKCQTISRDKFNNFCLFS